MSAKGQWRSGRSVVMATRGMVASSQPIASAEGIRVLMDGGNAADAAVTMAAILNVVEPMMTGIGGDVFAIYYDTSENVLRGLNASGRSPAACTREFFLSRGLNHIPEEGFYPVMVPAALRGWEAFYEHYCTMDLKSLLTPAIRLAEEGFPVAGKTASLWGQCAGKLRRFDTAAATYLANGRAPVAGEVFRQPALARALKKIAEKGIDIFYKGELAEAIADYFKKNGGLLSGTDLDECQVQWVTPISTDYLGHRVFELPPNGQGLVVLEALNILKKFDLSAFPHNCAECLHLMIEATRLSLADGLKFVADPDSVSIPLDTLLSQEYADGRSKLIEHHKALSGLEAERLCAGGDTTYFTVVDRDLNVASFINSIFHPFGSGIVEPGTGICFGNRGCLFSMDEGHLNVVAPRKRPYNTIIPAMLFRGNKPVVSFGVMGGFMQPQGHLQLVSNLLNFHMNIQEAIESGRYRILENGDIALEPGIEGDVATGLENKGHKVVDGANVFFGGGQGIVINYEKGILEGGSDPRMDGCAIGWQ